MEILFFFLNKTENILKRDMTDVHKEELDHEEEQDPRVRTTSSGRILIFQTVFIGNTA